jgi:hypothetical protein
VALILVLHPPWLRPMAWSPVFLSACTVLMSTDDGAIDHRVFVIGIYGQVLENAFPNPALGPSAKPGMHEAPTPKSLRQISPRNPCTIAIKHRFNKQTIVFRRDPYRIFSTRQQVFDSFPLISSQGIASHHRLAPRQYNILINHIDRLS